MASTQGPASEHTYEQGPAHRTSRAFRYYKAPRTQLRRAGDGDGEGEEVEGDEYLETMQQRSAVWRELSACVVRPAAVMAMLLLVLHAPHSALSQWPICYDHFVPDKIGPAKKPGCPMRNGQTGQLLQDTEDGFVPCYHTTPWDVTSPSPQCRADGCRSGSQDSEGCCCGASEPGALRKDPFLSCQDEKTYGLYEKTGGSAGSCPECKQGLGSDNGVGGRILETYGNPALIGQPDPQVFGHVSDIDWKLSTCSTAVRSQFAKWETAVNIACDVKTYYRLRTCGDCAKMICLFHNNLHWVSNRVYNCAQDLFLRRLECYSKWYHKWCTCKAFSSIPYAGKQGDWEGQCVEPVYFRFVPNRRDSPTKGTYPVCSGAAQTRHLWTVSALLSAFVAIMLLL